MILCPILFVPMGRGGVVSESGLSSVFPSIFVLFFLVLVCPVLPPVEVSSPALLTLISCENTKERNRFLKIEIYQKINIFSRSQDLNSFSQKNIDPSQELTKK